MSVTTAGLGVPLRSLEADDVAGSGESHVARAATKPRIDTYELGAPPRIVVVVEQPRRERKRHRFTRLVPRGGGATIEVNGVPSTDGGTRIAVDVPLDAGPGDVIVRRPGSAYEDLSNPVPSRRRHALPASAAHRRAQADLRRDLAATRDRVSSMAQLRALLPWGPRPWWPFRSSAGAPAWTKP